MPHSSLCLLAAAAAGGLGLVALAPGQRPPAEPDSPARVRSAGDVDRLANESRSVVLRMDGRVGHDALVALVAKVPALETLVIEHPGNEIRAESLQVLAGLTRLRSLTLTGDPFLYCEEFAALGRLRTLRTLRLSLP